MFRFFFLTILLTIIGFSSNNPIEENNAQNICILDTVIIKSKNLTIPERNDRILYHLMVEDWEKPVHWSLSIISNQDTLLHISAYDKRIDKFFNDPYYLGHCNSGYIECKKLWYLEKIYNFYTKTLSATDLKRRQSFEKSSKHFAEIEQSEYGNDINTSLNNWSLFWKYYQNKPIVVLSISYAQEGRHTSLLAYHPILNKLVPIYRP